MIQITDEEFAVMIDLINRALKSIGDVYAMKKIVEKANAQQAEQQKEASEKRDA